MEIYDNIQNNTPKAMSISITKCIKTWIVKVNQIFNVILITCVSIILKLQYTSIERNKLT